MTIRIYQKIHRVLQRLKKEKKKRNKTKLISIKYRSMTDRRTDDNFSLQNDVYSDYYIYILLYIY